MWQYIISGGIRFCLDLLKVKWKPNNVILVGSGTLGVFIVGLDMHCIC